MLECDTLVELPGRRMREISRADCIETTHISACSEVESVLPSDPMRKHTTLDLDEDLVREAAAALGTRRTTETVHAALAEVVARRRRAMLARHDFPDLTPDALAEMRAPRRAG